MSIILPHDINAEKHVLGLSILNEHNAIELLENINDESVFFVESHQEIFKAIQKVNNESKRIDAVSLSTQLRKQGSSVDFMYLTEISNFDIIFDNDIKQHLDTLKELATRRNLIEFSQNLLMQSVDLTKDVNDVLNTASNSIENATQKIDTNQDYFLGDLKREVIEDIEKAQITGTSGLNTGIEELDKLTNGLQNGELIVIAGRPAMGKTTLALQIAINLSIKQDKKIAIFSLEMSRKELAKKVTANQTKIYSNKIKTGQISEYEYKSIENNQNIETKNLIINDKASISINELKAKISKYVTKFGVEMVIIDYLQLIKANSERGKNREQEVAEISRNLKLMAKTYDIPIIVLSQLNRSCEQRPNKRPLLSDLRESGAIEQDADVIMFCFRPEYYGFDTDEEGNSYKDVMKILVEKNRNGTTGTAGTRCYLGFSIVQDDILSFELNTDINSFKRMQDFEDEQGDLPF